jgi:hypothetical protein
VVLQIGLESVLKWSGRGPSTLRFSLKIVDILVKAMYDMRAVEALVWDFD